MHRRQFLKATVAASLVGAAGCATVGTKAASATGMTAAQFHASRRFVDLAHGRVAYVERGAGPVAVFCHGYFLNGFQWRGALDRLAGDRRCIVPWQADHAFARSATQLGNAYNHPATTLTDEVLDCYLAPLVQSPLRKRQADQYLAAQDPNPLLALEPALRRCTAPTRIVWGTGDSVMDPASADWLARTFPGSRGVRRVAGAKLFFPEELPDLMAEELRQLWRAGTAR